ncbi:hypothetical protein [Streptomyces sp. NPDC050485]|uniref:hypothetical protein n=1 Tax=Streptomyces sp. NPDC050485 TaxID=3365617 RepID=UPI00378C407F
MSLTTLIMAALVVMLTSRILPSKAAAGRSYAAGQREAYRAAVDAHETGWSDPGRHTDGGSGGLLRGFGFRPADEPYAR